MLLCIILADFQEKREENTKERGIKMEKNRTHGFATIIAKYIVAFCAKQKEPILISNIKLQKLLYLVFGEYYLAKKKKLFPEPFQAWQYGPVVASVYDEFCAFAGSFICLAENEPELPENVTLAIKPTIEANMKRDVFDLVNETHQPGSAWSKTVARNNGIIKDHPEILIEDIEEEFRERRDKCGEDSAL